MSGVDVGHLGGPELFEGAEALHVGCVNDFSGEGTHLDGTVYVIVGTPVSKGRFEASQIVLSSFITAIFVCDRLIEIITN